MSELSLGQIVNIATTEVKDAGINGDSIKNAFKQDFNNLGNNLADKVVSPWKSADDNIVVPADTKTLLGKDFSDLYVSCGTVSYPTSNNTEISVLKPGGEYDTEMHGSYLYNNVLGSYADLSLEQKIVYETTLLTKKYGYEFDINNSENNSELEDSFKDDLVQYMTICKENNLDWNSIVHQVSNELMTQTSDYLAEASDVVANPVQVDTNRVVAVRANRLMVSNAGTGYIDEIPQSLAGKLTKQDMENYLSDIDMDRDVSSSALTHPTNYLYAFTRFVENIATKVSASVKDWWEHKSLLHATSQVVGNAATTVVDEATTTAKNLSALQNDNGTAYYPSATEVVSDAATKAKDTVTSDDYFMTQNIEEFSQDASGAATSVWTRTEGARNTLKEFGQELAAGGAYGVSQIKNYYASKHQESQGQSDVDIVDYSSETDSQYESYQ